MNKMFYKSFSRAMKAKEILQKNDIYSRIEKTTNKTTGCGYNLIFDDMDYGLVTNILKNFGS